MIFCQKFPVFVTVVVLVTVAFSSAAPVIISDANQPNGPIRITFEHKDLEREYFVWLPKNFDEKETYRALVVAHGGGGNGRTFWLTGDLYREANEIGLQAIIISPSFLKTDPNVQRFPVLGEGDFLEHLIENVNKRYKLFAKILLTGYSRGAQFAHRFALGRPDFVHACAPLAAGAWTTPDGRFLMYNLGEIKYPASFLALSKNGENLVPAQRNLFDPQVAAVASATASAGADNVFFMVMCGTLDKRFEIAKEFVSSLQSLGYSVRTVWPKTEHGGRSSEKYRAEFAKYSQETVQFFKRVTDKSVKGQY
jgi:pimeloyl-ACP methyl ester carboxylesterase